MSIPYWRVRMWRWTLATENLFDMTDDELDWFYLLTQTAGHV